MAVSATSTSMTERKKEEELERVPCIRYPVTFKDQTEALLDSGSEVNAISQAFALFFFFFFFLPVLRLCATHRVMTDLRSISCT